LKNLNKEYETTEVVSLQDPRPPKAERTDDFTREGQNPRSILTIAHILGAHVPVRLAIILIVGFDLSYLLQPPPDRQHIAPTSINMPTRIVHKIIMLMTRPNTHGINKQVTNNL
jgi:hypothetical protein